MTAPVVLPARVDLAAAVRLANELKEADGPVQIDGSKVTQLGALGLQALVAGARSAKARDCAFELTGSSEKMIEHMAIMGVTPDQFAEGTI